MVGVGTLHLFGKYVEFALLHGPIEDKYIKRGRSRLLAAFDLPINSRWLGLRELDSKGASSRVSDGEANSHVEDVSEAVRPHANGRALKSTTPAQLPTTSPRRTRLEASVRHLNLFFIHFTMTAFLCILLREVGSDTIGNARGIPNSVNRFLSENTFVLLPFLSESSSLSKIPLFFPPSWIIEIIIEWFGFLVVWQTLVMGFRFVALLGVASGLYEVEAWETDLFNAPWKAESLIDMWGKRWHQLFRVGPTALLFVAHLVPAPLHTVFQRVPSLITHPTLPFARPTAGFLPLWDDARPRPDHVHQCPQLDSSRCILLPFGRRLRHGGRVQASHREESPRLGRKDLALDLAVRYW